MEITDVYLKEMETERKAVFSDPYWNYKQEDEGK